MARLPPPSREIFDDVYGWGIGNGIWRQSDATPLMIEDWLGCNVGVGGGGSTLERLADCLEEVLGRPHLRPLLEHHDDKALKAVAKTVECLRRSESLHKVKRLWGSEWRAHVASDELPVGQCLVWSTSWKVHRLPEHFVGVVLEKVDASTLRYTTCNGGDGLQWHDSVPASGEALWKSPHRPQCCESFEAPVAAVLDPYFADTLFECQARADWASSLGYYTALATVEGRYAIQPVATPAEAMSRQKGDHTSATKGPDRALRYLLRRMGLSKEQLKELKLAMRLVLLEQVGDAFSSA